MRFAKIATIIFLVQISLPCKADAQSSIKNSHRIHRELLSLSDESSRRLLLHNKRQSQLSRNDNRASSRARLIQSHPSEQQLIAHSTTPSDSLLAWVREVSSDLVSSNDEASAIAVDQHDGSIYVTGSSESDFLTVKYNPSGDTVWTARYIDPYADVGVPVAISVDSIGNVYVTGMSHDNYTTIKYNAGGDQQWVRNYNGPDNFDDQPTALIIDNLGNVYVTGYSYSIANGYDFATVKYTPAGVQSWVARLNGSGSDDDQPSGIAVDTMGNVYVAGYITNADFSHDYMTVKYNNAGVQQWTETYDGPAHDEDQSTGIAVDLSGSVSVTGYSLNENFSYDYVTIRYSTAGVRKWIQRYNGLADLDDHGMGIVADAAGNVVVTGTSTDPFNALNIVTIKYTSTGTQQWLAIYGGNSQTDNFPVTILIDQLGNVYIGAETDEQLQPPKFVTVKYNSTGGEMWSQIYSDPGGENAFPSACSIDRTGNVYSAGFVTGIGISNDYLTVKYNFLGIEQWMKRYDGPRHSEDEAIAATADVSGNVYVTGFSNSSATNGDYLTVKYDPAGLQQWAVRFNGSSNRFDSPVAIVVDGFGNVYVTGSSEDTLTLSDYATVKYNSAGSQQWVARYNGSDNLIDEPTALTVDGSGNVYVTGKSSATSAGSDYLTIKYNTAGVQQWVTRYDGPAHGNDGATALAVDKAGKVFVTGFSVDSLTKADAVTIQYNSLGAPQWLKRYNGPANGIDRAEALALDGSKNVYVAGFSEGSGTQDDYLIIKYDSTGFQQWVTIYNGSGNGNDHAVGLSIDAGKNCYVSGYARNGGGSDDIVTIKFDSLGVRQWVANYDGYGSAGDYSAGLTVDSLGNVYVAGYGDDLGRNSGYTFVKYDLFGNILTTERFLGIGPKPLLAFSHDLALDGSRNVVITGTLFPTMTSSIWTTIKYHATQADFSIPSHTVTFGSKDITCGPNKSIISVTNTGNENLYVFSVTSNDTNFSVSPISSVIASGSVKDFTVSFVPAALGPKFGHIVFSHGGSNGIDTVAVSGVGTGTGSETTIIGHYGIGWQLISLPVTQSCPNVPTNVFEFRSSYIRKDTIYDGKGYWKKLSVPDIRFIGYAIEAETISVNPGWNIIGSLSYPVAKNTIVQLPPNNTTSQYFGYTTSYFIADTVLPAHAYWIKVKQGGTLVFHHSLLGNEPKPTEGFQLPDKSMIRITDAEEKTQRLYIDDNTRFGVDSNLFALPPPPPNGSFDARFASGRMVEYVADRYQYELPIIITTTAYPVTIRWNMTGNHSVTSLRMGNSLMRMEGEGNVQITDAGSSVILFGNSQKTSPSAFALHQNYPNPFNPATKIQYQLPVRVHVTLKIYNVLGQVVETLVDEIQNPGIKTVEWNATTVSNGVYFYRFTSNDFSQVRKMVIMR